MAKYGQNGIGRICRWSDQVADKREQKKTKEFSLTVGRLGVKQKNSITHSCPRSSEMLMSRAATIGQVSRLLQRVNRRSPGPVRVLILRYMTKALK